MGHWQPKTEITRDAESDSPIQAIVGRTAKKPTAAYQQDLPDMTGQITRSDDYVAVPKVAPVARDAEPTAPKVEYAPPVMPAQPTVQNHQQPTEQTMSNEHTQPCHQHPVQAHPVQNWYGGQPMHYAAQPLVVQQLPAQMHNVQTNQAPDVTYRKGILGIGSEAFDLTGEMLDSFEFKAKFIQFLTQVLSQDLNVQAALFTPNEAKQDMEIAVLGAADKALEAADTVLKHAIQCAFYEDGDIVFPGLKNECGKDARVKVPPVNGIKYDLKTSTLAIGSAELVIPIKEIATQTVNAALNAAATSLPKIKKAEDITDVPVFDREDACAPAKSATLAQLSEAIIADGIPQACEAGKLAEVKEPTGLLAFGAKKCREFGFVSLADFMLHMAQFLPLAPAGEFPIELRGWGAPLGVKEQRYPVKIKTIKPVINKGVLVAAGDTAVTVPVNTNTIDIVVPESGIYMVTGQINGAIKVDTLAAFNSGNSDRRLSILVDDGVALNQGDVAYYAAANMYIQHVANAATLLVLEAGQKVSLQGNYFTSGTIESSNLSGQLSLTKLGNASIDINPIA